ncbi:hypothetical protein, partial [Anaeromyxobacter sp. SG26]|uniref:hypothetical protein n=1 Tax=Anaeromyxobacter sp. SG26 TaxID=2925407 RepID=UPI001F58BA9D
MDPRREEGEEGEVPLDLLERERRQLGAARPQRDRDDPEPARGERVLGADRASPGGVVERPCRA